MSFRTVMDPVSILKELIKFPTFQIAADRIAPGMKKCASYLSECLEQRNFRVEIDELYNVTAVKQFSGEKSLLLNTHFDTVAPAKGWNDALKPKLSGGKLYGLGTSDAKGGIAAILSALSRLEGCRFSKLIVQFVNYEDNSVIFRGKRWLGMPFFLSKNPRFTADYGINVEPSIEEGKFSIGLGCTGRLTFNISTIGKEAHSSTPNEGKNAIYDMAKVIETLRLIPSGKYNLGGTKHEMPINVARIEGGRAINIVPGECKITCERRLFPGESPENLEKQIAAAIENIENVNTKCNFWRPVQKPYAVEENEEIVLLVKRAVSKTLGYDPQIRIKRGRTDSTYLYHNAGIKTAIIGPGNKGHIENEFIDTKKLAEFTEVLENLLQDKE